MKKLCAVLLSLLCCTFFTTACGQNTTSYSDLMLLDISLAEEFYGIATKKDNTALRDMIQIALNECIEDGTAEQIAVKWFGSNTIYQPNFPSIVPDPNATYDKDVIVMGGDVNFAPMAFQDNGQVVGFDLDLARAVIQDKMGKTLEFQPISWDQKEAELNSGKIDVLWNGLTITQHRVENMSFTDAYMKNTQAVVVRKDSGIQTKEDLNGKVIAMQKNSTAVDTFKISNIDAKETVELMDKVACLNELKTGRADAVIMDSVVANYYLNTDSGK